MGFEVIENSGFTLVALNNEVKFRNSKKGGATFSIARDVYASMGSPARVEVLVGNGEDAGFLMIRGAGASDQGYTVIAPKGKGAARFGISAGRFGMKPIDAPVETLTWRMEGSGLIVELPVQQSAPRLVAAE